MAGGAPKWVFTALSFYDTVNAKQGDLGSKVLPPAPTGVVWKAGSTVETKWNIRANVRRTGVVARVQITVLEAVHI